MTVTCPDGRPCCPGVCAGPHDCTLALEFWEAGNAVANDAPSEDETRAFLIADAARTLPPGAPFELRKTISGHYGRSNRIAWYYASTFEKAATWGDVSEQITDGGYIRLGQFTTPAVPK